MWLAILIGACVLAAGYVAGWRHARAVSDRERAFEALSGATPSERHARELDQAAIRFGKQGQYILMRETYDQASRVRKMSP